MRLSRSHSNLPVPPEHRTKEWNPVRGHCDDRSKCWIYPHASSLTRVDPGSADRGPRPGQGNARCGNGGKHGARIDPVVKGNRRRAGPERDRRHRGGRRRLEHGAACVRQRGDRHDVACLRFCRALGRPPRCVGKPPGKRLVAAIAGRRRMLGTALRRAGRTADAHVKVIVMPPERPDLRHP